MREFSLQQRYRVQLDTDLTMPDIRALTQVYLPIIGHEAFTLYLTLACYPHEANREYIHTDLLDQVGLSHHAFLDARARLEGMGLMKTYQQDLTEKTQWVYEMLEPMSTQAFLADDTLASLLAHYLGESTLNKLVADTLPEPEKIPGENVTASFFDLVGAERFKKIKAPVEKESMPALQASIKSNPEKLNLNMMSQMLQSFNVPMRTLKENEAALLVEKNLYGLDDVTLVRLIQQNLTQNHAIDMPSLRKNLQMQAKANQRQAENVIAANEVQPDTGSALDQSKPASAAEQLLQQVQSLSPVQYLQALRQEKGGFVTDNELKSLEDIAQLKRLPNEVINVMLYELTVVEQKTSLNRNLMQTISNDWSQAGVKTAKDAFSYLQKRQQQKQQTPATPKRRYQNQRPVKNETRPDWEEQRAKAAANSNQQADAQRKLDALLKANQAKQEEQPQ